MFDKERECVDKSSMANRRSPKIADDIAKFLDRFLAGFEQSWNVVIKVQQATPPQILPDDLSSYRHVVQTLEDIVVECCCNSGTFVTTLVSDALVDRPKCFVLRLDRHLGFVETTPGSESLTSQD